MAGLARAMGSVREAPWPAVVVRYRQMVDRDAVIAELAALGSRKSRGMRPSAGREADLFKAIRKLFVWGPRSRVSPDDVACLAPVLEGLGSDVEAQIEACLQQAIDAAPADEQSKWRAALGDALPAIQRLHVLYPEVSMAVLNDKQDSYTLRTTYDLARLLARAFSSPAAATPGRFLTNLARPQRKTFGRESVVALLHELLDGGAPIVVCGAAGVGKTTVVLEALSSIDGYAIVWMIASSSKDARNASFLRLGRTLGLACTVDSATDRVRSYLAQTADPWLLILDDLPAPDALQALAPPRGGTIIATSRVTRGWKSIGHVVELPPLSGYDSTCLLLDRCSDGHASTAEVVAATAGGLPVALDHLGRVAELDGLDALAGRLTSTPPVAHLPDLVPEAFVRSLLHQLTRLEADHGPTAVNVILAAAFLTNGTVPRALIDGRYLPGTEQVPANQAADAMRRGLHAGVALGLIDLRVGEVLMHEVGAQVIRWLTPPVLHQRALGVTFAVMLGALQSPSRLTTAARLETWLADIAPNFEVGITRLAALARSADHEATVNVTVELGVELCRELTRTGWVAPLLHACHELLVLAGHPQASVAARQSLLALKAVRAAHLLLLDDLRTGLAELGDHMAAHGVCLYPQAMLAIVDVVGLVGLALDDQEATAGLLLLADSIDQFFELWAAHELHRSAFRPEELDWLRSHSLEEYNLWLGLTEFFIHETDIDNLGPQLLSAVRQLSNVDVLYTSQALKGACIKVLDLSAYALANEDHQGAEQLLQASLALASVLGSDHLKGRCAYFAIRFGLAS